MSTSYQRHIRIRAMCGSYLLKRVDKRMVTFLFVILMFRALQLVYIVYSWQCFFYFVWKVKPTQCYFRFHAIDRTKKLTCKTDEILITVIIVMQSNKQRKSSSKLLNREKMSDKETGLEKNIILALLHQPIKFVHFHIGSVKAVLDLILSYWPCFQELLFSYSWYRSS